MDESNNLLINLDKLHTTQLGRERMENNLFLDTDDVVNWCKRKFHSPNDIFTRNGKNWYAIVDGCIITINTYYYST